MPEKSTVERARKAKRAGIAPTTQAGSFVREEIHHVREGKHGARSTKQAIAIESTARRRETATAARRREAGDEAQCYVRESGFLAPEPPILAAIAGREEGFEA